MAFQAGDQVWLHLDKKHFKGHHHKLLPIRYSLYTILNKIGENAYKMDLPPQLGIHNVINVNHVKLFEPSLLEEPITITHPVDNILDSPIGQRHYTGHSKLLYKTPDLHFISGSPPRSNSSSGKVDHN